MLNMAMVMSSCYNHDYVSDIIEEIHVGQKKRDEALLNQMRETRSDRENLLKQIHDLQKQTQL